MSLKDVEKLISLMENTDISEIEYQTKEDKIKISRAVPDKNISLEQSRQAQGYVSQTMMQPQMLQPQMQQVQPVQQVQVQTARVADEPSAAKMAANIAKITSPLVGTFYRAPAPGAETFVEIGRRVKKGDTLCIVEAMKLMNEIEADCDGVIKEILVENAKPVEYGEILFLIEK